MVYHSPVNACPNCQGKVSDKVAVCPLCGAPLLKSVPCRACGEPIPPGATTCSACHAPIGAPTSVQLPTVELPPPSPVQPAPLAADSAPKPPRGIPPIVKQVALVLAGAAGLALLVFVAYLVLAKSDAQCKREAACEQAGLCSAAFQTCVALTTADCAKTQNCLEYGECSPRDGKCVVASDTDCAAICKTSDRCLARDGRCVCDPSRATSCLEVGKCGIDDKGWCSSFTAEGCKRSTGCAQEGLCGLAPTKDKCVAGGDDDCAGAGACKRDGRCFHREGACVRIDCAGSADCAVKGRCSLQGGVCVAAKDADCDKSEWCKKLGRCKAAKGACLVTDAGCKASEKCKTDSECYVSADGEACVTKEAVTSK